MLSSAKPGVGKIFMVWFLIAASLSPLMPCGYPWCFKGNSLAPSHCFQHLLLLGFPSGSCRFAPAQNAGEHA
jgi:hypothetical protein